MTETLDPVQVINARGTSQIVLVCEHASNVIPARFGTLGLPEEELTSHVAWDPGALQVADAMARRLNAKLVAGTVSRLVYDCNRAPTAPDAITDRSEWTPVPGNTDLTEAARAERVALVYAPFRAQLASVVAATDAPVLVTIHSFTPIYRDVRRAVEIGILHDRDSRLADAMLALAPENAPLNIQRNQPYDATDGVTHTLVEHALPHGHLNVMIEVRSDLIADAENQARIARVLTNWLQSALSQMRAEGPAQ